MFASFDPAFLTVAGPFLIAFVTASGVSGLELMSSNYARTWFVVVKDWALWLYVILYGLPGVAGFSLLDYLVAADKITLEGLGLSSPSVKALYVGLAVKRVGSCESANGGA